MRSAAILALSGLLAACSDGGNGSQTVRIDGSSTVFPITEAVAEYFQTEHRGRFRVTVGLSGTGGGFKRFCAGETDISNASRQIKETEVEACEEAGVVYLELPVAWDGLSVMVNPQNDPVQCLTVEELRRIWEPGSEVQTWQDVRPEWPDEEIRLYGPGTDSGTFDYFTEAVLGESGASRPDYQASEDDNVLVQGVAGDRWSLGYFGYAYYVENPDKLDLVAVDGGTGCVEPSEETIENQTYAPLARPLYLYVNVASLERPEVRAYVEFMLEHARELVPPTGYIPLSHQRYQENLSRVQAAISDAS